MENLKEKLFSLATEDYQNRRANRGVCRSYK